MDESSRVRHGHVRCLCVHFHRCSAVTHPHGRDGGAYHVGHGLPSKSADPWACFFFLQHWALPLFLHGNVRTYLPRRRRNESADSSGITEQSLVAQRRRSCRSRLLDNNNQQHAERISHSSHRNGSKMGKKPRRGRILDSCQQQQPTNATAVGAAAAHGNVALRPFAPVIGFAFGPIRKKIRKV